MQRQTAPHVTLGFEAPPQVTEQSFEPQMSLLSWRTFAVAPQLIAQVPAAQVTVAALQPSVCLQSI
ncbi:MAG: hypothetical protein AMXMBFR56_10600 [Polyangiaceae bacterium]